MAKEKRTGGRKNNTKAFTFEDTKRTVSYISNYAEDNALVLPGRIPGFKRNDIKLLPSSDTKVKVYKSYRAVSEQEGNFTM